MSLGGFLSGDQTVNPDFYDWNVAYVKYCDGASFAGNVLVKSIEKLSIAWLSLMTN